MPVVGIGTCHQSGVCRNRALVGETSGPTAESGGIISMGLNTGTERGSAHHIQ